MYVNLSTLVNILLNYLYIFLWRQQRKCPWQNYRVTCSRDCLYFTFFVSLHPKSLLNDSFSSGELWRGAAQTPPAWSRLVGSERNIWATCSFSQVNKYLWWLQLKIIWKVIGIFCWNYLSGNFLGLNYIWKYMRVCYVST